MRKPIFEQVPANREDARKERRRRVRHGDFYHLESGSFHVDSFSETFPIHYENVPRPEALGLMNIQQTEPPSAKVAYLEAARTLSRDNLQPTWGRVQQLEEMEYDRLVNAVADDKLRWLWSRMNTVAGNILEEFEGFVDKFDADVAHISLRTCSGEIFYGQYPTAELMAKGIQERRRFKCRTVEAGSHVKIDLEAIPDREVSEARELAIKERLRKLLGDDDDSENAR